MTDVKKAANILNQGGIVIFPTDTAFGIGCRIDKQQTIKRLFKIRKRPISQAMPVLVDSIKTARKYFLPPLTNIVRQLMEKYWPGALTIVYNCRISEVDPLIRASGETIGLRMPNHKAVLDLLGEVGVPLLGSSANFHGDPTPYKYEDLNKALIRETDFVLKGVCQIGLASTVVDCTQNPFKIIRWGKILPEIP